MSTEQAQRFLEKISTAQVKNKLKETTDAACSYGVSNSKCIPISSLKVEKECQHGTHAPHPKVSSARLQHLICCLPPISLVKERKEVDGGFLK